MTDAERTRQFYKFALLCEDNKQHKCSSDCRTCPLNISLYPNIDAGDAVAIRTAAAIEYHTKRNESIGSAIGTVLTWVFWIVLAAWCIGSIQQCMDPPTQTTPGSIIQRPTGQEHSNIQEARKYVHEHIMDFNDDNKINCIDYAILFFFHYPNSKIIANQNRDTGMNHMFNAVKLNDGRVIYIEPQPTSNDNYIIDEVWSKVYDSYYNFDWSVYWVMHFSTTKIYEPDAYDRILRTANMDLATW